MTKEERIIQISKLVIALGFIYYFVSRMEKIVSILVYIKEYAVN